MNGHLHQFTARKMRKNFAGVIVVILVGIVICFALANLVLMTDQQLKSDGRSDRLLQSSFPDYSTLKNENL